MRNVINLATALYCVNCGGSSDAQFDTLQEAFDWIQSLILNGFYHVTLTVKEKR